MNPDGWSEGHGAGDVMRGADIFRYYGNVLTMGRASPTQDGYLSHEDFNSFQSKEGEQGQKGDTGAIGPIGLTGPAGPAGVPGVAGVAGQNGVRGSKWFYGQGAPTITQGVLPNDMYIDLSNPVAAQVYAWVA
jgi:hypothetical protein